MAVIKLKPSGSGPFRKDLYLTMSLGFTQPAWLQWASEMCSSALFSQAARWAEHLI